jgi:hypothetical protein
VIVAAGVDDPFGPVDQDPDAVRDVACRLVAPDQVCSPPDPPEPSAELPGWISALIELLVLVAFVAAAIVLLVLLARSVGLLGGRRRARRRGTRVEELDVDEVEPVGVAVDRSREPSTWRAEADEHRRAGRYRDALRCRYRALVGDLARLGLIDEIPGRTTGEERAQLAAVVPAAASDFDAAASSFDDAWYGDVDVDDADVERFVGWEATVLERSRPHARPERAPSADRDLALDVDAHADAAGVLEVRS